MTPRGTSPYFWSAAEGKALSPYLRALAKGEYRDASVAARAYLAEAPNPPQFNRSFKAVQTHIIEAARKQGVRWAGVDWSASELRAIKRYARAAAAGRFASVTEAARACRQELHRHAAEDRTRRSVPRTAQSPRSLKSLHDRMLAEAHALGWSGALNPWTTAEKAVLRRYLHELLGGHYRYVHEAACACARELEKLGRASRPAGDPSRAIHPRTANTVKSRLQREAKNAAIPRFRSTVTADEAPLIEEYARLVDRGEYGNWKEAAEACRKKMLQRAETSARARGLRISGFVGHSLHTIHDRMLRVSRSLELRGPRRVLWTEPELRRCGSWVRWLVRHRAGRRRMRIFSEAAAGLQEELERMGYDRTLVACKHRLHRTQQGET